MSKGVVKGILPSSNFETPYLIPLNEKDVPALSWQLK